MLVSSNVQEKKSKSENVFNALEFDDCNTTESPRPNQASSSQMSTEDLESYKTFESMFPNQPTSKVEQVRFLLEHRDRRLVSCTESPQAWAEAGGDFDFAAAILSSLDDAGNDSGLSDMPQKHSDNGGTLGSDAMSERERIMNMQAQSWASYAPPKEPSGAKQMHSKGSANESVLKSSHASSKVSAEDHSSHQSKSFTNAKKAVVSGNVPSPPGHFIRAAPAAAGSGTGLAANGPNETKLSGALACMHF